MSVIATVLNEYGSLPRWLRSLESQSRLPDEFVIIDGGSYDGTWELLKAWRPSVPVVLHRLPGSTIAEARNYAISRASCEIIAITDAGTIAESHWLERLIGAFDDQEVDVAAGFFLPVTSDSWSIALAATTLPGVDEVPREYFLPSSRSVAVRTAWLRAGFLYPEWLDYCEDLVFDMRLKRAGARFEFVPDAIVHFEPRRSMIAFIRQYYRYARGDGKAGLFPARHFLRYATYLVLLVVLTRRHPGEVAVAGLLSAVYMRQPAMRLWKAGAPDRHIFPVLLGLSAVQRLAGDLAKMAGYPAGLRWRWRRFGSLGWRTSWPRISPRGSLWQPPPASIETLPPRVSRVDESRPGEM